MKEKILSIKDNENIDIIGFTKIDNYIELESIYNKHRELDYKCSFEVGSAYDKTHLNEILDDYNSFIVIGVSYNNSIGLDNKLHLSSFCFGEDYHIVLREKLEKIGQLLKESGYKYKIFVDNNILDERYIAFKAGLGFYGKNGLLINEKSGSLFFIGILATDCVFEYDSELNKKCVGCNKCIDNCPGEAITKDGINAKKCLSYITQKKKLSNEEEKLINNCVYGCDICTNICPYNNKNSNNFVLDKYSIIDKEISKEEWNKYYSNKACHWRGLDVVNRNIMLAKENLEKRK